MINKKGFFNGEDVLGNKVRTVLGQGPLNVGEVKVTQNNEFIRWVGVSEQGVDCLSCELVGFKWLRGANVAAENI